MNPLVVILTAIQTCKEDNSVKQIKHFCIRNAIHIEYI